MYFRTAAPWNWLTANRMLPLRFVEIYFIKNLVET